MEHRVNVRILASNDKRSFVFEATNEGSTPVEITIPHPRTDVMLWRLGDSLDRAFFPLTWEQLPQVTLQPGATARYRISLAPYWLEFAGEVEVECIVLIDGQEKQFREKLVLDIPSRRQLKEESDSKLERGEEGFGTQHALTSIVETA